MNWRKNGVIMTELEHFTRTGIIRNPFKLSRNDWTIISKQNIDEKFMLKWKEFLDWKAICTYQKLNEKFIERLSLKYLYLDCIAAHQVLSEEFMDKYANNLNWSLLCSSQYMSEEFIREHLNLVKFGQFPFNSKLNLSIDFIREFADKMDWEGWWLFQPIKYKELYEFKDTVYDWRQISRNSNLPIEVIEHFKNELNWEDVCLKNHLSEDFMEKYIDYINWDSVSYAQDLSEDFITRYADKVNWNHVWEWKTKHFSENFFKQFGKRVIKD